MRRRLCGKLHGGPSQLLARPAIMDLIARYWPIIRDFCPPHLELRHPLGDPRRNIAITFGKEKLEWCGYPMVKKF